MVAAQDNVTLLHSIYHSYQHTFNHVVYRHITTCSFILLLAPKQNYPVSYPNRKHYIIQDPCSLKLHQGKITIFYYICIELIKSNRTERRSTAVGRYVADIVFIIEVKKGLVHTTKIFVDAHVDARLEQLLDEGQGAVPVILQGRNISLLLVHSTSVHLGFTELIVI